MDDGCTGSIIGADRLRRFEKVIGQDIEVRSIPPVTYRYAGGATKTHSKVAKVPYKRGRIVRHFDFVVDQDFPNAPALFGLDHRRTSLLTLMNSHNGDRLTSRYLGLYKHRPKKAPGGHSLINMWSTQMPDLKVAFATDCTEQVVTSSDQPVQRNYDPALLKRAAEVNRELGYPGLRTLYKRCHARCTTQERRSKSFCNKLRQCVAAVYQQALNKLRSKAGVSLKSNSIIYESPRSWMASDVFFYDWKGKKRTILHSMTMGAAFSDAFYDAAENLC